MPSSHTKYRCGNGGIVNKCILIPTSSNEEGFYYNHHIDIDKEISREVLKTYRFRAYRGRRFEGGQPDAMAEPGKK